MIRRWTMLLSFLLVLCASSHAVSDSAPFNNLKNVTVTVIAMPDISVVFVPYVNSSNLFNYYTEIAINSSDGLPGKNVNLSDALIIHGRTSTFDSSDSVVPLLDSKGICSQIISSSKIYSEILGRHFEAFSTALPDLGETRRQLEEFIRSKNVTKGPLIIRGGSCD